MDSLAQETVLDSVMSVPKLHFAGRIQSVQGTISVNHLQAAVGDVCWIRSANGKKTMAEIIGFANEQVHLLPMSALQQVQRGDLVVSTGQKMDIAAGMGLLGRVVNAFGQPIDGLGPLRQTQRIPLDMKAPHALSRKPIHSVFATGQRAIDSAITIGKGQRVGPVCRQRCR